MTDGVAFLGCQSFKFGLRDVFLGGVRLQFGNLENVSAAPL